MTIPTSWYGVKRPLSIGLMRCKLNGMPCVLRQRITAAAPKTVLYPTLIGNQWHNMTRNRIHSVFKEFPCVQTIDPVAPLISLSRC